MQLGPEPEQFIWATGIENTFIPQTQPGRRALDEYELMGHYEHWREDLALARELGVQAIRWGVPWYRVEPRHGSFDWSWTDRVLLYLVEELGITPIIDLMHYGCPLWLRKEFANPAYPEVVAAYARAFAKQYRDLVHWYTPLNEPYINALQCGKRGIWPPHLRSDRGFALLTMQLAKGIRRTIDALREEDPESVIVHVEATGVARAAAPELAPLAAEDGHLLLLSLDLLSGKVDREHPLLPWLLRNGAIYSDLKAFVGAPVSWDVLGLNFYPQWATKELYFNRSGKARYRLVDKVGQGFAQMVSDYHARYARSSASPLMITETSAFRSHALRERWLDDSLAAIRALRGSGVPVHGYTWFPLFTMVDWRYRLGRRPVEKYYIQLGLYRLAPPGSSSRWEPTPLVPRFQDYVDNPEPAVGRLIRERSRERDGSWR